MQKGVHRLFRHHAVFAELFVTGRLPVCGKCLQIPLFIRASRFHELKQRLCLLKRAAAPACLCICRKRVNGKCLIVGMLCAVAHRAVRVNRPEYAAIFLIRHPAEHVIGVARIGQQRWLFQRDHRLRKEPENPAVKDASLCRLPVHGQVIAHIARVSAVFLIQQSLPEWKNHRFQMPAYFLIYSFHAFASPMIRAFHSRSITSRAARAPARVSACALRYTLTFGSVPLGRTMAFFPSSVA